MGDDRPTHAVPELRDVLGDLCRRSIQILRFEKLADLVGHVDQLVIGAVHSFENIGGAANSTDSRLVR
jgi:hypothetical protein